jgi:beta-galactosidase GanA
MNACWAKQKFNMGKFNRRKLNNVETKTQYKIENKIGMLLWETWTKMHTSTEFGKIIRKNIKSSVKSNFTLS